MKKVNIMHVFEYKWKFSFSIYNVNKSFYNVFIVSNECKLEGRREKEKDTYIHAQTYTQGQYYIVEV